MKRIAVVTPPDARFGFALAGVRQHVTSSEGLEKTLLELVADGETGVLVVDERLVEGMAQERLGRIEDRWPGVLVVLPAPEKEVPAEEDYAMRLIRRAIGYQVRLRL